MSKEICRLEEGHNLFPVEWMVSTLEKMQVQNGTYSELLSKFGEISFQWYVPIGITRLVFYGDLVYKLRKVKCEANFVSSDSKILKRLRRLMYDQVIIERMLCPYTALYRFFLKHYTNKAVGTIWRDLSKPPQRRQGPDPRRFWLLVATPLVHGPDLASIRAEHSLPWWLSLYSFYMFVSSCMFVY